jgi:hypothetical protein
MGMDNEICCCNVPPSFRGVWILYPELIRLKNLVSRAYRQR